MGVYRAFSFGLMFFGLGTLEEEPISNHFMGLFYEYLARLFGYRYS